MSDPEPNADADARDGGRRSKVSRVLETYGLEGLGEEMAAAWTDEQAERKSLRDLADLLNKRIIEASLRDAGGDPLEGEVETMYTALRSDEPTSGGTQRDVRGRLERAGLDIETLERDLVSYQAIRTYLKKERGLEYDREPTDPVASSKQRIERLGGRLQAVTEQRLEDLRGRDAISLGDHRVLVQVQVYCEDCGRQYSVGDLLDDGGCACDVDGE